MISFVARSKPSTRRKCSGALGAAIVVHADDRRDAAREVREHRLELARQLGGGVGGARPCTRPARGGSRTRRPRASAPRCGRRARAAGRGRCDRRPRAGRRRSRASAAPSRRTPRRRSRAPGGCAARRRSAPAAAASSDLPAASRPTAPAPRARSRRHDRDVSCSRPPRSYAGTCGRRARLARLCPPSPARRDLRTIDRCAVTRQVASRPATRIR